VQETEIRNWLLPSFPYSPIRSQPNPVRGRGRRPDESYTEGQKVHSNVPGEGGVAKRERR
jgi:hypothetical protein